MVKLLAATDLTDTQQEYTRIVRASGESLLRDHVRLSQILVNLGTNAIECTHEGEAWLEIVCRTGSETSGCPSISASDTGIGIDITLTQLDRMFREHRISGLPVVSDDGDLMGIASKTDVFKLLQLQDRKPRGEARIWEIVTPEILWVSWQEHSIDVAQKRVDARIHRVLEYAGDPMRGIVWRFEFMRVIASFARQST